MKIYKANKIDISEIQTIFSAFLKAGKIFGMYKDYYYIESNIIKNRCFIIKENNKIIGAMCIKPMRINCEIETLAIDKNNRGNGAGRKLVDYAIKFCKLNNFKNLRVYSHKKLKVKDFYLKCGFKELNCNHNCYKFEKKIS